MKPETHTDTCPASYSNLPCECGADHFDTDPLPNLDANPPATQTAEAQKCGECSPLPWRVQREGRASFIYDATNVPIFFVESERIAALIVAAVSFCANVPIAKLVEGINWVKGDNNISALQSMFGIIESNREVIAAYREKYDEHAAELTALRAQLNEEANRWIPVAEKLPEHNKNVLVFHNGGQSNGHLIDVAHLFYGGWFRRLDHNAIGTVTHWRPLPEPPADLRAAVMKGGESGV